MTRDRLKYLLDRYLENRATEEELKEYADWYRSTGEEGLNMVGEQDDRETKQYTANLYNRIVNVIYKNESQQKKTRQVIFLRWIAAASVVLIAGAVFLYNGRPESGPAESGPAGIAEVKKLQPAPVESKSKILENHGSKKKKFVLNDSSIVELFPESKLVCEFSNDRREFYLTGKGFFDVAKDASRPFTVYSNSISTTALETSFAINAYPANNNIEVSLYTGRVVVKHIQHNKHENIGDVYLLPGQSLCYSSITGMTTLKQFKSAVVNELNKNSSSVGGKTGYKATFDQVSLADVLSALEKGYGVDFIYDKKQLSDMYFSGNIPETDSLARVLKRIAALHSLRINATLKGYTIRKINN